MEARPYHSKKRESQVSGHAGFDSCGSFASVDVAYRFDLSEADGESLEKQFEFDLAQAEVADYHAEAMEKIDTYKRR